MKKLTFILGLALTGCMTANINTANTYRNTSLDFAISYPKDWAITDYNENDEESVTFVIANQPAPEGGFNIMNAPEGLKFISVNIEETSPYAYLPAGSEREPDEYGYGLKEEVVFEGENGRDLNLYIFDYPEGYDGFRESHESGYAFYNGVHHDFTFWLSGWGFTEEDLVIYKEVLASFEELT